MIPILLDDDEFSYPLHTSGSISTLPAVADDETIAALHQAIFEVTGKRVDPPEKPRIGFLP